MNVTARSIRETAALIATHQVSPVELVDAHLASITTTDPQINSFITVTADQALGQARAAEQEIMDGVYRGPLHGIPLALKDVFDTAGILTTSGSAWLRDNVPTTDAAAWARLRAAGAVLLGKLNLHEWGMSVTTNNPFYGACHNPWDLQRIPGGSSGGAGAALAARLCMGALGTDTGGSVRIPAALCGVVGFKPTYGRVSTRGVTPLCWYLDHVGTMARTVEDAALLLQAIAGHDGADPYAAAMPVADYTAHIHNGVAQQRIGLAWNTFLASDTTVDPEVVAAVGEAANVLRQLGALVEETQIAARDARLQNSVMLVSDAALFHRERLAQAPERFGADVREALERGMRQTAVEYAHARRTQTAIKRTFAELWMRYDLLITPTTAITAPLIDEPTSSVHRRPSLVTYTAPFNLAGLPALSAPCGFTANGLPVGLQIVGPPWAEAAVLRAGYAHQQATAWHLRTPTL